MFLTKNKQHYYYILITETLVNWFG